MIGRKSAHASDRPANQPARRLAALIPLLALVTACVPTRWEKDAPDSDRQAGSATDRSGTAARSSRGNPPFYEVFGRRYYVMDASNGYQERGVASWYGKKFHGKPTSSGEIYNMHAMTAAHKTLPLPTDVRVTNLRNGKSIVVKVNDRGPFVDNRLIDLSYAAALRLEMITAGTTLVEVESLDGPPHAAPQLASTAEEPVKSKSISFSPIATAAAQPVSGNELINLYLQVGAFGEQHNATSLQRRLQSRGMGNVVIRYDAATVPPLYRVRLGPIGDVSEYDALVARLAALEIRETHLVTETAEAGIAADNPAEPRPMPGG